MVSIKTTIAAILIAFCALSANAQVQNNKAEYDSEFKIGVEIRPRFEYLHGYKTLAKSDQSAGMNINQRSRLNLFFKNRDFYTRISLQDVRVWGNRQQIVANEDEATSIHEAWLEALITKAFSLKVGRQEIIYDDHRIFGSVNWAQQARSHDAAIFKYTSSILKAELAFAYNQDAYKLIGTDNKVNPKNYKTFQNLWLNFKACNSFNVSFLFLNNGLQLKTGGDAYSQTIGPRLSYIDNGFTAHATFYYQGGYGNKQVGTPATAQKINASYIATDISYKFAQSFTAVLGFERLSGNSQLKNSLESNEFKPLYGTNHKFNGFMDYFYVGNAHGNVGLQDIYLILKTKLNPVSFGLATHLFSAAADVVDMKNPGSAMNSSFGTEFDFFLSFPIVKGMKFIGGYSQMLATETLEVVKKGSKDEINNSAYIMISLSPDIFIYKK